MRPSRVRLRPIAQGRGIVVSAAGSGNSSQRPPMIDMVSNDPSQPHARRAAADRAAPPMPETDHLIVLFDGSCGMCSASVRFMLARDPGDRFRFVSSKTALGQSLLAARGLPAGPGSVVVLDADRTLRNTDATLRLVREMPAPWRWLSAARFIPRPLRDGVYRLIAANRTRIPVGRNKTLDACPMPTPQQRAKFLA